MVIVREETDVESEAENEQKRKKKKAKYDTFYFMGYFKWYWGQHGFFKAVYEFFGQRIFNGIIYSVFNSVGLAIGSFFFRKFLLANWDVAPYLK